MGPFRSEGFGWGGSLALSPFLGPSVDLAGTRPAISSLALPPFPSARAGGALFFQARLEVAGLAAHSQTLELCSWEEEWPFLYGEELEVGAYHPGWQAAEGPGQASPV